ncbi:MAG TPA: hypothetical protein PKX92_13865 [Edaphocola sp.]|nr:hypothetical protein [Edaphocola sp.]
MKTHLIKISAIALLLLVGFAACKKQQITETEKSKNLIAIKPTVDGISYNGQWLSFNSIEAFNETIENLKSIDEDNGSDGLDAFEEQFHEFTSIRKNAKNLDENDDVDLDRLITSGTILYTPDDEFGSLISKDGFIQIGDSIYNFRTTENSYVVSNQYETALLDGVSIENIEEVTSFPTTFAVFYRKKDFGTGWIVTDKDPGYPGNPMPWGGTSFYGSLCNFQPKNPMPMGDYVIYLDKDVNGNELPKNGSQKVRFECKVFREAYGIYKCVGVKMKIQNQKSNGKWKTQIDAQSLKINLCARGTFNNSITGCPDQAWGSYSHYLSDTNDDAVKKTIEYFAGFGCTFSVQMDNINAHYIGKWKDKEVKIWIIR